MTNVQWLNLQAMTCMYEFFSIGDVHDIGTFEWIKLAHINARIQLSIEGELNNLIIELINFVDEKLQRDDVLLNETIIHRYIFRIYKT